MKNHFLALLCIFALSGIAIADDTLTRLKAMEAERDSAGKQQGTSETYYSENCPKQLAFWQQAAQQGQAIAQLLLADCYASGKGIAKDEAQAVAWYRKAADQGNANGQYALWGMYSTGKGIAKDEDQAEEWLVKAAEQGNAEIQTLLAMNYEHGWWGITKDETEAMEWYRKAAEQGNASAQSSLAHMYYSGNIFTKDEAQALVWYRKAAEQGDIGAQSMLGLMYQYGQGTTKDETQAVAWYRKAAEQGNIDAQVQVGRMYEYGQGIAKDETQAMAWYRKADEQRKATGKSKLAEIHTKDIGITQAKAQDKQNSPKASSAKEENVTAQANLEPRYADDKGITPANPSYPKASANANTVVALTADKVNKLERRVALVIGNGAYQHTGPLPNPANDAQDIAQALKKVNFQVILKTDANLETMVDAIYQFGENLKDGDIGLFYYSGHGFQVKGENYLLPVDAKLMREDDIKRKAINANDVLEKMGEGKSHLNLVFLDACRDNPFPSSTRSLSRGLVGMNAPNGTLLVFSTNPDNVAADGNGRNGTYTKHLLQQINQPGLEVGMLLRKVRTAVKEETGGQQVPWENGSIEGEFYFIGDSP